MATQEVEDPGKATSIRRDKTAMKRIIWISLISLVIVLGGVVLMRLSGKSGAPSGGGAPKAELEQEVTTFSIDGRSPKGVKQWHLDGKSAEIIGDDIHLHDLKAIAYGDDATINLSSDSGIYRKELGEVELFGNVDVVSDEGYTLKTERAKWSQNTKEISTEELVHIDKEGMSAVGTGGMANSEEKKAVLNKDVTVKIEPDTRVDCDGSLIVLYKENMAVFSENVMVEDKDGRLFADKLTVEFNGDTQELDRVVAEGNVKLKKGKSYTISDMAIYTETTKSAQLLGRPRIIIDPDEIANLDSMNNH